MTSMHDPTPEFERFLEWQVTSALRRQDRFALPAPAGPRRYLPAAATIVIALLVGAIAGAAPGRIQDNQQRTQLLQLQQGELQVAQMQLILAKQAAETMKRRFDVGTAGQDEMASAERDVQEATLRVQRVQLNLEEVQRSGRAAQDDLTSPLVGGRDFVMERLGLDQQIAAAALLAADRRRGGMQKRYDVGLVELLELKEAEAALFRAAGEMKSVGERITLRLQYLAGKLSANETTRSRLLLLARGELAAAEKDLDVLSQRYALLQTRVKVGTASEVEAARAQLEMLSRKQDIERLRARVTTLEKTRD